MEISMNDFPSCNIIGMKGPFELYFAINIVSLMEIWKQIQSHIHNLPKFEFVFKRIKQFCKKFIIKLLSIAKIDKIDRCTPPHHHPK